MSSLPVRPAPVGEKSWAYFPHLWSAQFRRREQRSGSDSHLPSPPPYLCYLCIVLWPTGSCQFHLPPPPRFSSPHSCHLIIWEVEGKGPLASPPLLALSYSSSGNRPFSSNPPYFPTVYLNVCGRTWTRRFVNPKPRKEAGPNRCLYLCFLSVTTAVKASSLHRANAASRTLWGLFCVYFWVSGTLRAGYWVGSWDIAFVVKG